MPRRHRAVEQLGRAIQLLGKLQLGQLEQELGLQLARRQVVAREGVDMRGVAHRFTDAPSAAASRKQLARDDELLHFGRAFVDAQRADLAIQPLDRLSADARRARPSAAARASMTCCAPSVAAILAMAASRVTCRAPDRAATPRDR